MMTQEHFDYLVWLMTNNDNNLNGTVFWPMGKIKDGRELCLVFGYEEGYDKGEEYQITEPDGTIYTLCAKLAINIDDLQCDYDIDWYMPWNKKTGDVWDTNMAISKNTSVDWYNSQAEEIINEFYKGTIECY